MKKKSILSQSLVPKYREEFEKYYFDGLVNELFYNAMYPDVSGADLAADVHYKTVGFQEERLPNPFFHMDFVRAQLPPADRSRPPILHYLGSDDPSGLNPCPYLSPKGLRSDNYETEHPTLLHRLLARPPGVEAFPFLDVDHYKQQLNGFFEGDVSIQDIVEHYLLYGLDKAISPNPLFEYSKEFTKKDYVEKFRSFKSLFTTYAENSDLIVNPIFDVKHYQNSYSDINMHPVMDYLYSDIYSNKSPHPLFDEAFYKETYGHELGTLRPFTHFLSAGGGLSNRPNRYFDPETYKRRYEDTHRPGEHPIQHYMRMGHLEWFEPSDLFGQRFYLSTYPEIGASERPALAHYITEGRKAGYAPLPPKPFFDATQSLDIAALADIAVKECPPSTSDTPTVSIIIPVYGQLGYTLRCLISIFRASDTTDYEVIVADDRSPDESGTVIKDLFAQTSRVNVLLNKKNLGFLRSCNNAAMHTRGKYILFLNNDTAVLDGWLDELVDTLTRDETIGLTGSKLVYPNGLLQEAGGVIYADGSCANYGKLDSPSLPKYNHARDVDYISGAAMLLSKKLWEQVGGFSDYLAPAYYEDTDIAMKVRGAGKRVVYQPKSVVVHYEGISSGTDLTSGVKKHQVINSKTFYETWKKELLRHPVPGDRSHKTADHRIKGHIMVLDAETPQPDKDSGSITAFFQMKILTELGYRVTFVPENLFAQGKYAANLERLGVEVIAYPHERNLREYILKNGAAFDCFILSRASAGAKYFNEIRDAFPGKPIVFDTVDLHFLRMQREYELTKDTALLDPIWDMRELELGTIRKADATILVSEFEIEYLKNEIGPFPSVLLPLIYEEYENPPPFKERSDIAFIGGFRHPPNLDAVEFLTQEIWPRFREHDTGAKLHIIGSHMPAEMQELACEDIIPVGFVEDLESYLANIRFTVAPLRYGAGVKGKVGNSLRMGVPVVATPVASEGMGLEHGKHLIVADKPDAFAEGMNNLYNKESEWTGLSLTGRSFVMSKFGYPAAKARLADLVRYLEN
ncbi:glycosyltransferase [Roseibium alexandrii]|uniref:Putative glycosyltransferase EpsJ n=1 Tax=Roseibium alexandrii TaxID=388408 RepID=A0A0M7AM71_9HYPH|nr:glycosyltransferase [Roseibium alexandrii]CTQ75526.1 putative glycosyltransferase EpsJ [Roseibium alexandrii]